MKNFLNLFLILAAVFTYAWANAEAFDWEALDLGLQASVSETYDDNITYLHQNEKEDFITSLLVGLSAQYAGKTRSLDFAADISQQIFADYDGFNNISEEVSLNFQQEFSKFDRIELNESFSHTYEPRSFEEAFGRLRGRYSYYRNRFSLAYTQDVIKELSLSGIYTNEVDQVSDKALSDSYLNSLKLEANYYPSSADIFLFYYRLAHRTFDPGDSAITNSLASGLKHYLTGQLFFEGWAGFDFIHSYNDKNYIRPLIQASLTSDIDENSRAAISFSKEYYTTAYSQDLFNRWQFSANLQRRLFKRLSGGVSAFYGRGEYVSSDIKDESSGVSAGFSYDLREGLSGNLNYSYSNYNSTSDSREYSKNRIVVGINAKF